jgi:hypothetical protein
VTAELLLVELSLLVAEVETLAGAVADIDADTDGDGSEEVTRLEVALDEARAEARLHELAAGDLQVALDEANRLLAAYAEHEEREGDRLEAARRAAFADVQIEALYRASSDPSDPEWDRFFEVEHRVHATPEPVTPKRTVTEPPKPKRTPRRRTPRS